MNGLITNGMLKHGWYLCFLFLEVINIVYSNTHNLNMVSMFCRRPTSKQQQKRKHVEIENNTDAANPLRPSECTDLLECETATSIMSYFFADPSRSSEVISNPLVYKNIVFIHDCLEKNWNKYGHIDENDEQFGNGSKAIDISRPVINFNTEVLCPACEDDGNSYIQETEEGLVCTNCGCMCAIGSYSPSYSQMSSGNSSLLSLIHI